MSPFIQFNQDFAPAVVRKQELAVTYYQDICEIHVKENLKEKRRLPDVLS